MFKFLFGKKAEEAVVVETQRETFERLIKELNSALDALPEKPTVTISPESGHIGLVLPENLPDEALKLPAPEPEAAEPEPETASDTEATTTEPEAEEPKFKVSENANKPASATTAKEADTGDKAA